MTDKIIIIEKKTGIQRTINQIQYNFLKSSERIELFRVKSDFKELENKPNEKADVKKEEPKTTDDLTKIEGIGKVIAKLLSKNGINTFSELQAKSEEEINEILGEKYSMMNPSTWSAQAMLASEKRWDDLTKWQEELKG